MSKPPQQPLSNDLKFKWNSPVQRSSWCKFRDDNEKEKYGQIEYFFRISFSAEPALEGLPVALITTRKSHRFYRMHRMKREYACKKVFVAATNIFSTPVGLVGLTEQKNPIVLDEKIRHKISVKNISSVKYERDPNKLDSLLLIDLERSRLKIKYRNSRVHRLYNNTKKDCY